MACSLTPSTTFREDFIASTGSKVTFKLKGPATAAVELVHATYAQTQITSTPPQFTVAAGAAFLVILAEASKPGTLIQLIEVCGATEQVLDRFHFDPMNPARGYIIRGA